MSVRRGTYVLVAEQIRQWAVRDRLSVLPSETALAERYGVGRDSIRKALTLLEDTGFVKPVAGVGWLVGQHDRYTPESLADELYGRLSTVGVLTIPGVQEQFDVSRYTARRALDILRDAGVVLSRPGVGFVVETGRSDVTDH